MQTVDRIFTGIFVVETALRIYASGSFSTYFHSTTNRLDGLIITSTSYAWASATTTICWSSAPSVSRRWVIHAPSSLRLAKSLVGLDAAIKWSCSSSMPAWERGVDGQCP